MLRPKSRATLTQIYLAALKLVSLTCARNEVSLYHVGLY